MERSRATLVALICVLISSISGIVVEMRVKPGDDVTVYCDCARQNRLKIAWLRNCTHKQQPPLMILSEDMKPSALPHYSLEWNKLNHTYDLLVKNITESDLGLYYCALHEKNFTRYKNGVSCSNDVLHYGNRTTFLSLLAVLFSSISGIVEELRVKRGDNITIYGDCEWKAGFKTAWVRKSTHEHQPPLIRLTKDLILPRYSFTWNISHKRYDLLVDNITESDLGLYYCALQKSAEVQKVEIDYQWIFTMMETQPLFSLCWISAQTSASKTLTINRPPTPVSEMERSRVALIAFICVLISNISGIVVEMRVKPGDNVTVYCDCTWKSGFKIKNHYAARSTRKDLNTDFRFKTLTIVTHPAPVSEMVRPRATLLIAVMWVGLIPWEILMPQHIKTFLGQFYASNFQHLAAISMSGEVFFIIKVEIKVRRHQISQQQAPLTNPLQCHCFSKISGTDIRFKDSHHCQPPASVSEMERSRAVLITLMCVLISSISGIVVEMRVKPGDDVNVYCDFTWKSRIKIVWVIKPSDEHQPPLFHLTEDSKLPHYSRVWNNSKGIYDLLVKNITGSELGLYYCAVHEIKISRNEMGERLKEDLYHDGNRTTFLSFQVVSSICVYCICTTRTKGVLISSISGIVVEMRVKPGDDVTVYCDCTWKRRFNIVWVIKPSDEHQPPLFHLTEDSTLPHYSHVWNNSKGTYDLLVKNITGSELGLYYCAVHEIKISRNEMGERLKEDLYLDGNRTTFLSFQVVSSIGVYCICTTCTKGTLTLSDRE
ncbi:hypothetical protein SRHO_G00248310 [Serrasalmus rhombeus]